MLRDVLAWSFPTVPIFGIMVRIHFVLPLFMIGLVGRTALSKDFPSGTWHDATMLMVLMFIGILIHEFGHCFACRYMEGESDEILLWPLGGLAFARSLPHTPAAHFVFALGGPLASFLLCVVSGLAIYIAFDYLPPLSPLWYPYREKADSIAIIPWTWQGNALPESSLPTIILMRFFWINWVLFLFNTVLVGLPFDSGRMLQAALWPRLGHYQATKVGIYAGFVVAVAIGLFAIIYAEPLAAFLTFFVFISCAQEWMALESAHEDSLFGYDFSQGYTSLEKDETPAPPKPKKQNFIQRWLAKRAAKRLQQEQEQREADDRRMDELLEKIQKFGKGSLTDEEQRFLKRVAERYKKP